jgi:hypothetical protein
MPLVYSREDPILGTGGAFVPLREVFAGAEWCCSSTATRSAPGHCRRCSRSTAARSVAAHGDGAPRRPARPAAVRRWRRHRSRGAHHHFSPGSRLRTGGAPLRLRGAYALEPSLLDRLPDGPSDSIGALFEPLLAEGVPLQSLVTWRPWHDLGTPERYREALLDLLSRADESAWRGPESHLGAGARLRRGVLEAHARLLPAAQVEESVVMPHASVGLGARLLRTVVAPHTEVPAESAWSDVLLAKWRQGMTEPDGSRRVGELLVVPLGRRRGACPALTRRLRSRARAGPLRGATTGSDH